MASEERTFTRLLEEVALRGDEAYGGMAAWRALRSLLRRELRRRGLWPTSPGLLGIFGWDRWESSVPDAEWRLGHRASGALDELLVECFDFAVMARERSLRAQLAVKGNVEGLVALNVRNFVSERQKQNDPLGSRSFEVLQEATAQLVAAGSLAVLGGDARIRNETVVGPEDALDWMPLEIWSENVAVWCRDLLPDLITAKGPERRLVVEAISLRMASLFESRPACLLFRDMIGVFKQEVRGQWAALFAQEPGFSSEQASGAESADRTRLPDTLLESEQNFLALVECVLVRLRGLATDPRTRSYLNTLWEFLRVWATDGGTRVGSDDRGLDRLPSQRQLAEQLKIPRERLPAVLERLALFLQDCRKGASHERA